MQPLISIIVPIYNVEEFLKECVDSILQQTYTNLEIILVDDGSPDMCGKICDEYSLKDDRIIVIHKENGGLSSARNAGLDVCNGEYISFIDSDDYVSPYFIEMMYKGILYGNADIATCVGSSEFILEENYRPTLVKNADDCLYEIIEKKEALQKMLYQNIATGAPFRLYKKYIFEQLRFPEGYVFEDVATTYKTFIAANRMVIFAADIYAYRIRRDSIVRMNFSEKKMVVVEITQNLYKDICDYDEQLRKAAASRAFAQNYHVFLQIPYTDKKNMKLVWNEIKKYRAIVAFDCNKSIRKKNKIAAIVTFLGMNISYVLGKVYLKAR